MTPIALPRFANVVDAAAPFALALAIGAAVLLAAGFEPLGVYRLMIQEAFGGQRQIAATLTAATPLLLTGLAAAIAFRAGIFNVGAEGCFYLGGIVAAVIGFAAPTWPSVVLILVALATASLVGGLWLVGPGLLRARLGVDEVVTTLMLNFIAIALTSWLVNGPLLARGSANSATPLIAANAELPRLLPPTTSAPRVHHQPRPRHAVRDLEPLCGGRPAITPRGPQSAFQPCGRH